MRALMLLACLPLAACGDHSISNGNDRAAQADGKAASRSFALSDFTKVDLQGGDDVEVTRGDSFSVTATGPEKALDRLKIDVADGTLRVSNKHNDSWSWGPRKHALVRVTMPNITSGWIHGSGDLTIDRADGAFQGGVAGSGDLTIGMIRASQAAFSIPGSGTISAAGSVDKLSMSIAGSGEINAKSVTASSADVSISGSGDIDATVNGPATGSISGSGDVTLGGGAQCSITKSGSGDVHCG